MSQDVMASASPAPAAATAGTSAKATPAPEGTQAQSGQDAKTSDGKGKSAELQVSTGINAGTSADAQAASAAAGAPPPVKETPEEIREQLEAARRDLMANLVKKQGIDRQLSSHEAAIYAFETSYLSVDLASTGGANAAPFGNIVKGYDSYLKPGGAGSDASGRKKGAGTASRGGGGNPPGYATGIIGPNGMLMQPVQEEERLFSRSSGTYLDSLQLRDRDANVVSASEGDEDDEANTTAAGGSGAAAAGASGSAAPAAPKSKEGGAAAQPSPAPAATSASGSSSTKPASATFKKPASSDTPGAAAREAKRQKKK